MTTDMMVWSSESKTNVMPSSKRRKAAVPGCRASVAEDIVTEVLLRLPIKSVVRFRAVCRSWAKLLSSEEFCRLHRAITQAAGVPFKMMYFSQGEKDTTVAYSCSLSPGPRDNQVLFTLDYAHGSWVEVLTPAPCHGLNLLCDARAKAYYICNAAARAVVRLPPSKDAAVAHRISTGLGFNARTREYKVVRLIDGNRRSHEQDTIRCEVYTPGGTHGDCWRPAARGLPFGLRRYAISAVHNAEDKRLPPVFANGFLHWLIQPYHEFERIRGAILYFSVTEETFRCVRSLPVSASKLGQKPRLVPQSGFYLRLTPQAPEGHLVEMDNQLCLVRDLRDDPYHSTLEIWRLLDYSSGDWLLDHRIDLSGYIVRRELREPQAVRVIGSIDNGRSGKKIIITTCKHKVHEKFEKKVHTYDLSTEALYSIVSVIETSKSTYGSLPYKPPASGFSLFEDCLAPLHKTDEELVEC